MMPQMKTEQGIAKWSRKVSLMQSLQYNFKLHRMKLNGPFGAGLMLIPQIKRADDERLPSIHHRLFRIGMA